MYTDIYFFVEGNDDLRFIENIIKPKLKKKYKNIYIVKYRNEKMIKINSYIKSIKNMKTKYIFISDLNSSPCVTHKKGKILQNYSELENDNIIIVKKEIESWFLAGIDEKFLYKNKKKYIKNTENISKEQFNSIIPKSIDFRNDFIFKLFEIYNFEIALTRNESLKYFYEKIK